jgi:hypothetical protein
VVAGGQGVIRKDRLGLLLPSAVARVFELKLIEEIQEPVADDV